MILIRIICQDKSYKPSLESGIVRKRRPSTCNGKQGHWNELGRCGDGCGLAVPGRLRFSFAKHQSLFVNIRHILMAPTFQHKEIQLAPFLVIVWDSVGLLFAFLFQTGFIRSTASSSETRRRRDE